jgi:hypothetical protein
VKIYRELVTPGQILTITVAGSYFRIIECGADVTVQFLRGGRDIDMTAEGVGIGFWSKMPAGEQFEQVRIISPVGQLVRFGITRGEGGIDSIGGGSGNAQTAGGSVNVDMLAKVRATVKLMEPGLTDPDELDAVMGFLEAWPVTSTSQAIYLLTNAIRDSSMLMRSTIAGAPLTFAHPFRAWDLTLGDAEIEAIFRITDPLEPGLMAQYPTQITNSAAQFRATVSTLTI